MGSPWRLREGFATSSRALHEDVAGAEGFEKPPRRLREGFAKAPRAPPFGNDSSDNDKPPRKVQYPIVKNITLCELKASTNPHSSFRITAVKVVLQRGQILFAATQPRALSYSECSLVKN